MYVLSLRQDCFGLGKALRILEAIYDLRENGEPSRRILQSQVVELRCAQTLVDVGVHGYLSLIHIKELTEAFLTFWIF
jgi:hypothetical protein